MMANNDYRKESDLLGELLIPENAYYGVQTQRAIENFPISGQTLYQYPELIRAFAFVKKAAAKANAAAGVLHSELFEAISKACDEVASGKFDQEFPIDMIQGGAGTSMNMNANEVIANRALELLGHRKGEYQFCSPNDHVNLSQSTNDAYPTAIKLALYFMHACFLEKVESLASSFYKKGEAFAKVLKMGRTQLQDAVPMTLGQEFEAFGLGLQNDVRRLEMAAEGLLEVNMGGTAIGTGLNAPAGFSRSCASHLAAITGLPMVASPNLIEATPDTSAYTFYSAALKNLALRLSKICNDLRLLSSGPKAGIYEIQLPKMQPGSSIMPGKVNPVIPEVVNQVCFKVIGNDVTVSLAAEAGQLQLNVMEPVLCHAIMESLRLLGNACEVLRIRCVEGITANAERCLAMTHESIGLATALNPFIGYKQATAIAQEALETGKRVYDLVLEHGFMTKEEIEKVLSPERMVLKKD